MVSYHDRDFDYLEWTEYAKKQYILPEITTTSLQVTNEAIGDDHTSTQDIIEEHQWQHFYSNHNSGLFYKPRRYLYREFEKYLPIKSEQEVQEEEAVTTIVEAGCGHGCSIFPLLDFLIESTRFIATDFSTHALEIMSKHKRYDVNRIRLCQWDITQPGLEPCIAQNILCIFVLSAIEPEYHVQCLENMKNVLSSGGTILFRDYAEHDMTMYRHTIRLSDLLFRRNDGTLAYYFSQEYLQQLATIVDMELLESNYATVCVKNRSTSTSMNRVFLHAVLRKK